MKPALLVMIYKLEFVKLVSFSETKKTLLCFHVSKVFYELNVYIKSASHFISNMWVTKQKCPNCYGPKCLCCYGSCLQPL